MKRRDEKDTPTAGAEAVHRAEGGEMNCPACKSSKTVPGKLFNVLSGFPPFYFRPEGLKLVTMSDADVKIDSSGFSACVDCGLMWATLPAQKLKQVIQDSGSVKLKSRMT